ncbi:MAG: VanZ family protein [Bacillota bacterium]
MKSNLSKSLYVLFILYFFILLIVSLWGINKFTQRPSGYNGVSHNVIPFDTIQTYLFNFHSYNFDTWFYNTFGVVLLFVPLGFLLPVVLKNVQSLRRVISVSVCVSIFIEATQYITNLGVFDIDDIILNTIGTVLGFLLFTLYSLKKKKTLFN